MKKNIKIKLKISLRGPPQGCYLQLKPNKVNEAKTEVLIVTMCASFVQNRPILISKSAPLSQAEAFKRLPRVRVSNSVSLYNEQKLHNYLKYGEKGPRKNNSTLPSAVINATSNFRCL